MFSQLHMTLYGHAVIKLTWLNIDRCIQVKIQTTQQEQQNRILVLGIFRSPTQLKWYHKSQQSQQKESSASFIIGQL